MLRDIPIQRNKMSQEEGNYIITPWPPMRKAKTQLQKIALAEDDSFNAKKG